MVAAVLAPVALLLVAAWGWDRYAARRERRAAEDALRRHDLPAAAASLDRYIERRPRDPAGWFQAARTARRRGRFDDAGRYLARCQELGGPADAVRLERDLILVQQGDLGEADVRLRASIGPDHPDAAIVLEALARAYLEADRLADARQACEMWRELQPDHPWPWLWSGWIAERLNQPERATDDYRRALDLAPDDRDARVAYARALVRQRQSAAAAEHYGWVVARFPADAEAALGLARCRIEEGRAAEAVPLIERVLAAEPASFAGLYLRGRAAAEQGDHPTAEVWLRRALQVQPREAEALHQLVLSLRARQKDAEAEGLAARLEGVREDQRRLTELLKTIGPWRAEAAPRHEAGVLALRLGRTKEGVNLLHDALRFPGDHRPTHAALAEHYRRAGDPARADFHHRLAGQP